MAIGQGKRSRCKLTSSLKDLKNPALERRPEAGAQSGAFQRGVYPCIACEKWRESAFGFVEGVVVIIGIRRGYVNEISADIF